MKKAFVLISVSDRIKELNFLVDNLRSFRKFDEYDLCLYFQDPGGVAGQIKGRERYSILQVVPEKQGCHAARVFLVRLVLAAGYDLFVNMDDDMEVTEHTHYGLATIKASEPGTGFVLTNWARTMPLLLKKVPLMEQKFVPQVLVYQGGGMVYTRKIAELMAALPTGKYTFDHAWPLTAYINGYRNHRFLGSLAVHRVCAKGGMAAFMAENPPELLMGDLIDFKRAQRQRGNGFDWKIPLDKDLKPLAHKLHRQNRKYG